jgi:membrane-bound lytic murein transglycosylase B
VTRFVLIVVSVVVVGGCAGDDDDRAAPPPRASTTATVARTTTVAPTTTTTSVPQSPADLRTPADPAALAAVLTRVESELRSDSRDEEGLTRLGWEQDLAYVTLGLHSDWYNEVVDRVPSELRDIVAANADASMQINVLNQPQDALPAWTIRAPLPRDELLGLYREAEAASGVPWPYLAAIHLVETRLGRIAGTSVAGAQGPMQFMPQTWEAYGEGDVNNDRDAILAAGRYLAAAGASEDMTRALFAYNHSDQYVAAIYAYAHTITADPRAYDGYYSWQVHYRTTGGLYLLPEGYVNGSGAVAIS